MGSEHYCLRWNNHQSNLLGVFSQLLRDESLVDVTLACSEGHSIRAHKVVLSACSSYFQTLFVDHPSRHPIVILKDVRFSELRTLIEFMYKGEVNVEYCQLSALLKTAESLKVKGLAEMTNLGPKDTADHLVHHQRLPEQTEPTELTSKRQRQFDDDERTRSPSGERTPTPPPPQMHQPLHLQKINSARVERRSSSPPPPPPEAAGSPGMEADDGMDVGGGGGTGVGGGLLHSNGSAVTSSAAATAALCGGGRLPSPVNCDPVPGPSSMPPVQQVPLSLKKEVDWSSNADDKSTGESSSDFPRHPHESVPTTDPDLHSPPPHHGHLHPPLSPRFSPRPPSAHSSRPATPFVFPFPALATSLLEVGLCHPSLLGADSAAEALAFRCTSCTAGFPSVWLLEQHTALQHISGGLMGAALEKPFVCEQCGQSYRYRSAYVKHREQNHRARLPADKLFSCDVCGMQFRYLKSFKKHRLNHALERLHGKTHLSTASSSDYKSDQTDQVSSSNDETIAVEEPDEDNNKDAIKKEEDDDQQNNSSSDVDKDQDDTIDSLGGFPVGSVSQPEASSSSATSSLVMNLLETSSDQQRGLLQRERRFACPFCGKCVRSKENLKLHVRKHTGERPFVCLFCGRAFGGKSDLTRHLRIHTGERPYHCDMCGKCFARADYLSKHLTTHINTPR